MFTNLLDILVLEICFRACRLFANLLEKSVIVIPKNWYFHLYIRVQYSDATKKMETRDFTINFYDANENLIAMYANKQP